MAVSTEKPVMTASTLVLLILTLTLSVSGFAWSPSEAVNKPRQIPSLGPGSGRPQTTT
jgi:hypothetical protein